MVSPRKPSKGRTPQARLLAKLTSIVDALARRGAVSHEIELWSDDLCRPTEISFRITAVYGFDGSPLKAENAFLVEQLLLGSFRVQRPFQPDAFNHAIHVIAAMSVRSPGGGKPSRNGGKRNAAIS